ncbi:MAG TPA: NIPSNAP family protein [Flavisolibacter sp.]|jgi:hypothetical protein|nr:NIPSNAP family protein [Flavisolibacter sp.]
MNKSFFLFPFLIAIVSLLSIHAYSQKAQYYELRTYSAADSSQEWEIRQYLKNSLVPALHRAGISNVGVFSAIANDTAVIKKVVLLISYGSLEEQPKIWSRVKKDTGYIHAAAGFLETPFDHPSFTRMETVLLKAFEKQPFLQKPKLKGPVAKRVYELRSYESASESLFENKVEMFNKGGEVGLFARLNFNAIFYGSVIAGSRMPNLMYMTSFENKEDREAHWKAFGEDPFWKKLSSLPEYQNNVSHIDITFLRAEDFSDL